MNASSRNNLKINNKNYLSTLREFLIKKFK